MQARIAHPLEKRSVAIEQPVKPIDQDAHREQIEQRLVAPGLAARRRLRRRQPFGRCAGLFGSLVHGRLFGGRFGRVGCRRRRGGAAVFAVEPRRQLPGEFVEGAVFNRCQGRRFRFAGRPKRQDVFCGFHGYFQIDLL